MASGTRAPSWLSLPEVGTADLDGATIPYPTTALSTVLGLPPTGARGDLADPRPDAYSMSGILGRLYGLLYFDRIHVIPRERDLGSVVSLQEVEVEIYNAFLARARTLDDIVVTGPAGITVVDPLGTPTHYPASESKVYVVQVSAEGNPLIDNLITWEFDGIDVAGTNLALVGFRLIPFPFPPDMLSPVEEDFGYLTDVIEAGFEGMEQRVQLRAVPVGRIAYSVTLTNRREAQMSNAIMFGNQARAFGVARWQFQTPLAIAAAADDLSIYCTTTDIPFVAGGLVMLWRSPFSWEVQTIDSVESDHVVITSGLQNSWPATETAVVPMVVGRASDDEGISWQSLEAISQSVSFDIDGWTP